MKLFVIYEINMSGLKLKLTSKASGSMFMFWWKGFLLFCWYISIC